MLHLQIYVKEMDSSTLLSLIFSSSCNLSDSLATFFMILFSSRSDVKYFIGEMNRQEREDRGREEERWVSEE